MVWQGFNFLGGYQTWTNLRDSFRRSARISALIHYFLAKVDPCPWANILSYNCFLPRDMPWIATNLIKSPSSGVSWFVRITTSKSGCVSIWQPRTCIYSTHQSSQFTVHHEFPFLVLFVCIFVGSLTCPNSWVIPTTSSGLNNFPELQGWRLTIWFPLQVSEKYTQIRWILVSGNP